MAQQTVCQPSDHGCQRDLRQYPEKQTPTTPQGARLVVCLDDLGRLFPNRPPCWPYVRGHVNYRGPNSMRQHFYSTHGVKHTETIPVMSQMNGTSECSISLVLDRTRSLLFDTELLIHYGRKPWLPLLHSLSPPHCQPISTASLLT